jgi:hypothetical protein
MEREVDEARARGETVVYESVEEFGAYLESLLDEK